MLCDLLPETVKVGVSGEACVIVEKLNKWSGVLSISDHLHQTVSDDQGTRSLLVVGVMMENHVVYLLTVVVVQIPHKRPENTVSSETMGVKRRNYSRKCMRVGSLLESIGINRVCNRPYPSMETPFSISSSVKYIYPSFFMVPTRMSQSLKIDKGLVISFLTSLGSTLRLSITGPNDVKYLGGDNSTATRSDIGTAFRH